jgi:hypothetical protein
MNDKSNIALPEAPASQTIKIAYKGAEILLTQRDLEVKMLPFLEQAKKVIDWAMDNGFEAPKKFGGGFKKEPEYVGDRVCPIDGGKLIKPTNPRAPIKCENQKYDFRTKITSGCTFTEWPNQQKTDEIPERQISEEDYGDY